MLARYLPKDYPNKNTCEETYMGTPSLNIIVVMVKKAYQFNSVYQYSIVCYWVITYRHMHIQALSGVILPFTNDPPHFEGNMNVYPF